MAAYDPYSEQIIGLREQKALAQKLRDQSMQMEQGQNVSGWYVPASPWSAIAKGLQAYKANNLETQAEEGIKGIGEQRKAENEAWLKSAPTEQTYQVEDRAALPVPQQTQMGPSPYSKALRVKPTTEETLAWAMKAPGLDTGAVAQLGVKGAELEAARQARLAEAKTAAEAKLEAQRMHDETLRALKGNQPEKPLTEFQGKSTSFGTRTAQSHNILNQLEDSVNPLAVAASQKGGMFANWAVSDEAQRVAQAQRDFINAVLRQESGASISSSEFENAKQQYFPQPGDSEATKQQKRLNRELVIKGFARQAGPGGRDVQEVYNAGAPTLQSAPVAPAATPNLPSPNAIAAEMARRAAAANQGVR
jgi:hypothetical protein